jgi:PBP1b-binding outer membrane lipoprotein LpoB
MRKLILLALPALYLVACSEPAPPPPPKKKAMKQKARSDDPENFRAKEKPATY